MNKIFFLMGVSGSGKSTIGTLLAQQLNIPFFDGDDFHSKSNIKKMKSGSPLNDEDRKEWLLSLNNLAKNKIIETSCVIVCSALKKHYRNILSHDLENNLEWIYLEGDFDQIYKRLQNRKNHFMPVELLKSQFYTLEPPINALKINISLKPKQIVEVIKNTFIEKSEIGVFGLGVMGKSLSRNLANKGFKISMFNRHVKGLEVDVASKFKESFKELSSSLPFDELSFFVKSLESPKKILLMVNAGKTIDDVIEGLLPYLSENDILIDGGNSNYLKTKERYEYLKTKNINFIGAGISGGEEGALIGPSIMPGGDIAAYNKIKQYLKCIAAKDKNNLPCCTFIGNDGSGHFVKMIHNGIEYVEMQLLAEVYTILKRLGNNPDEIADILESWKQTAYSYLLDITIDILRKKEDEDWLINKIIDKAGNKGTGNWATVTAAQLGLPSTMIATSLFARYISFYKEERLIASKNFKLNFKSKPKLIYSEVLEAYLFARIINHYQGFKLIDEVSKKYSWNINLSEVSRIWTNGCIIKSDFMEKLVQILKNNSNILNDHALKTQILKMHPSAKKVVSECVLNNVAIPNLSDSVNFFNNFSVANSSANIIQAQRDYFGAHTYQRNDDNSGKFYHTKWK